MQKVKAKERKIKKLITNWFLRNLNESIIQVANDFPKIKKRLILVN